MKPRLSTKLLFIAYCTSVRCTANQYIKVITKATIDDRCQTCGYSVFWKRATGELHSAELQEIH